jgi:hypothetical protein
MECKQRDGSERMERGRRGRVEDEMLLSHQKYHRAGHQRHPSIPRSDPFAPDLTAATVYDCTVLLRHHTLTCYSTSNHVHRSVLGLWFVYHGITVTIPAQSGWLFTLRWFHSNLLLSHIPPFPLAALRMLQHPICLWLR